MSQRVKLVSRLAGGLGNQLFIYAASRRLALVNDAELVFDRVGGFQNDGYNRFYQLDWFNVVGRAATMRESMRPFQKMRRKRALKRNAERAFADRDYIAQEDDRFEPRLIDLKLTRDVFLKGLWQGPGYFNDIEEVIRKDLKFVKPINATNQAMAEKIVNCNAVALHVRFFAPPGRENGENEALSYYRKALLTCRQHIETPHFFIFSDQPEAARNMLAIDQDETTLVTHNQGDELAPYDMWLMSQCRHFITANSTFSWWGAWLGAAKDKKVFTPAIKTPTSGVSGAWAFDGLVPESWHQIANND